MNKEQKIKVALLACARHLQEYESFQPAIPQRFLDFWTTGEAFRYDQLLLPDAVNVPGWSDDTSFKLYLIAPFWENETLQLDDAVVGAIGDWTHAYKYLPLFVGGYNSFSIVVKLDDPALPVGLFEEGYWNTKDSKHYQDGVYQLASSLDVFLAMLVKESERELVEPQVEEEECFPELDY